MISKRELRDLPASRICQSKILPLRRHDPKIAESVKAVGQQQPLIVRPIPDSDKYEIIDGGGRFEAFKGDDPVLVEIRSDVPKDTEVFSISQATFRRGDRSGYEKALFYANWLKAIVAEKGTDMGAQTALRQESGLSSSAISQYVAINKLFEKLAELAPSEEFNALKKWSINKLYKLSGLSNSSSLLEVAQKFEKSPKFGIKAVTRIVDLASSLDMKCLRDPDDTPEARDARECRQSAEWIQKLVTEVNETLIGITTEAVNDSAKFSTDDVLQIFDDVSRTLKRLKKYSEALRKTTQPVPGSAAKSAENQGAK